MKMERLIKVIVYFFAFILPVYVCAQSTGDKLFMEGQKLQQTMTKASQQQAIKKFQAAKIAYTAKEKKTMCDNQIAICKQNIGNLSGKGGYSGKTANNTNNSSNSVLQISKNTIEFDGDKAGTVVVNVTSTPSEWYHNSQQGLEGESDFVKVVRDSEGRALSVSAEPNPSTLPRKQTITVSNGKVTKNVNVSQSGKTVILNGSTNLLEFGIKGGNKKMELKANSDAVVADNNGENWYIESKPDWVEVSVETNKKKGILGKLKDDITGGNSEYAGTEEGKTIPLKIIVTGIAKSSPDYVAGRRGEIIFASQNKKYTVVILQKK